jgi:hypothetical protein
MPLLILRPHDYRGNIGGIDGRIEKLGAAELRKMDQLVADLLDLASDLLPGFHPQLNGLADIFLENSQDRVAGLEIDFALREKIAASDGENKSYED